MELFGSPKKRAVCRVCTVVWQLDLRAKLRHWFPSHCEILATDGTVSSFLQFALGQRELPHPSPSPASLKVTSFPWGQHITYNQSIRGVWRPSPSLWIEIPLKGCPVSVVSTVLGEAFAAIAFTLPQVLIQGHIPINFLQAILSQDILSGETNLRLIVTYLFIQLLVVYLCFQCTSLFAGCWDKLVSKTSIVPALIKPIDWWGGWTPMNTKIRWGCSKF